MPQMSPIMWLTTMMLTLTFILFITTLTYSLDKSNSKMKEETPSTPQMNWKW